MNMNVCKKISQNILTGVLCAMFFAAAAAQTLFAQAGQSELNGTVSDQNGAVIAGVKVTLTETASGQTAETQTDGSGTFVFTNRKPGRYSVSFSVTGFQALVRDGITLTTGERIHIDQSLAVAAG